MKFTDTHGDYNQSCFELAGATEQMKNGNFALRSKTVIIITAMFFVHFSDGQVIRL